MVISRFFLFILLFVHAVMMGADGALDPSFNGTGMVTTSLGGSNDQANAMYIQQDGKIVLAGAHNIGNASVFALVRYNTDGSVDEIIITPSLTGNAFEAINGVAVQSDGKIVVVGTASGTLTVPLSGTVIVARYNPDGTLDASFGTGGFNTLNVSGSDGGVAVVVDLNGKVVIAGFASSNNIDSFLVARFNSNGSLDTTFNAGGSVPGTITTSFPGGGDARAVGLQADGKIIAAGMVFGGDFGMARYNTNGTLDSATFNPTGAGGTSPGTVVTDFDPIHEAIVSAANALLIQPDGKIILGGLAELQNEIIFAAARYNTDGSLDSATFNPGAVGGAIIPGTVITPIVNNGREDSEGKGMALQSDGKIILAGYTVAGTTLTPDTFSIVRYTTTGLLDTTFNGTGIVQTDFNGNGADGLATALQGDGKIVVAGLAFEPGSITTDFAAARYLVDTPPTPLTQTTILTPLPNQSFNTGIVTFSGTAQNPSIVDIFVDGVEIGSTVTIGITNTWSFTNTTPLSGGTHSVQVVGRYHDDGHVNLQSAIVPFSVCNVIANPATFIGCTNQPVNGTLTASGGTGVYTFSKVANSDVNGVAVVNANGTFTFTPTAGFSGVGGFSFQVTDSAGCTATASVTIIIGSPIVSNTAILSCGNTTSGNLSSLVTGPTGGFLFGGPIGPISCAGGTVTITPPGAFTFTGPEGLTAPCSFVFQVTDANTCSSTGLVTITPNAGPIVSNTAITSCNNTAAGNVSSLVSGGSGGNIFAGPIGPVSCAGGTVTIAADGTFTFTGPDGLTAPCSFVFQVTDSSLCSGTGLVTITPNAGPIVSNTAIISCTNTAAGNVSSLVSGGSGGNIFAGPIGPVSCAGGTVTIAPDGTFTFTGPDGLTAPCSFVFQVTDSSLCSGTGLVTVTPNTAPVANNATFSTCAPVAVTGSLVASVVGGTPPLVFAKVGTDVGGSAVVNADGSFVFTPTPGFVGTASFSYQVTDASGCVSNTATVFVAVGSCCPTAPVGSFYNSLIEAIPGIPVVV